MAVPLGIPLVVPAQFHERCEAAVEPGGLLPEALQLGLDGVSRELLGERLSGQLVALSMEPGELIDHTGQRSPLFFLKAAEVPILPLKLCATLSGDITLFFIEAFSLPEPAEVVSFLGQECGILNEASPLGLDRAGLFRDRLFQLSQHR